MARVFIDANIFINLLEKKGTISVEDFNIHHIFISPLSIHILLYVTKNKIPSSKLEAFIKLFLLISFDESIVRKAMIGPTADFEDNVQLHSAASAECDFFLTEDKILLKLKFFGKLRLLSQIK